MIAVFSAIAIFSDTLASGELGAILRSHRVEREISHLQDHFVVCGFGRVGESAVDELRAGGTPTVVLDHDERRRPRLVAHGGPYLMADATDEAVLRRAGIARAAGLLCAVDSDTTNVFIALTARSLNPGLSIVARSDRPEAVEQPHRAGVDRVCHPTR